MEELRFPIHVLVREESWGMYKGWIAQCLEYDITSQGSTLEDVKKHFEHTLLNYVNLLRQGELQLSALNPAPDEYHEQYWKEAQKLSDWEASSTVPRGEILLRVA